MAKMSAKSPALIFSSIFGLPNLLTLVRLPLAAMIWLNPRSIGLLVLLTVLAAISDMTDGWAARKIRDRLEEKGVPRQKLDAMGRMGTWLDPLCDKVFLMSLLGALYVARQPELFVLVCLVTREIIQLPLMILYRVLRSLQMRLRFDFQAGLWGKATTVSQFLTVALLLMDHPWARQVAMVTAVTAILAMSDYIRRAVLAARRGAP